MYKITIFRDVNGMIISLLDPIDINDGPIRTDIIPNNN